MKSLLIAILLLALAVPIFAQQSGIPGLERKISIDPKNQTIENVLTDIGKQADLSFSYNPEAINASRMITVRIENQTVRYALNQIFDGTVTFRERGKFIILQSAKQPKNNPLIVEGYLLSPEGERLADATVYSANSFKAATTDEYGYFRLELNTKDSLEEVRASKRGYEDAMVMPITGRTTFVNLELPKEDNLSLVETSRDEEIDFSSSRFLSRELKITTDNLKESFQRVVQFSLFPHVGTNALLSGSTSNLFSFNLFGGYVQSVKVLELGAIFNIVRYDAGVFQGAGVANFVGGSFTGFQGAGTINVTAGNQKGFQGAGVVNYVDKAFVGLQGSGVLNFTGSNFTGFQGAGTLNYTGGIFKGFQGAGVANIASKGFHGIQGAGVINIAAGNSTGIQAAGVVNMVNRFKGAQISGVINVSNDSKGVQAAGVINRASKIQGAQLAGVINIADSVKGIQGAGVINIAGHVKGIQLGLINISDTCTGVPIGLVNIVKRGHNLFELYTTETFPANIAFRSGTRSLHWIYMIGADPQTFDSVPLYTFGLGLGTTFGKSTKLKYDIDVLAQQVALGPITDEVNMLYRGGLGIDWKFSRKVSLFAGVTYNLYLVDSSTGNYTSTFSLLPPFTLSNIDISANRNLKTWVGFKAGLRLH